MIRTEGNGDTLPCGSQKNKSLPWTAPKTLTDGPQSQKEATVEEMPRSWLCSSPGRTNTLQMHPTPTSCYTWGSGELKVKLANLVKQCQLRTSSLLCSSGNTQGFTKRNGNVFPTAWAPIHSRMPLWRVRILLRASAGTLTYTAHRAPSLCNGDTTIVGIAGNPLHRG